MAVNQSWAVNALLPSFLKAVARSSAEAMMGAPKSFFKRSQGAVCFLG
jgi:hypothetical protein